MFQINIYVLSSEKRKFTCTKNRMTSVYRQLKWGKRPPHRCFRTLGQVSAYTAKKKMGKRPPYRCFRILGQVSTYTAKSHIPPPQKTLTRS